MPKTSGTIGMRCLIGLLQMSALIIGCVIVHKIDEKTQENCRMIAVHSEKLSEHDSNFQEIYLGTFSSRFAKRVQRHLDDER